MRNVILIICFLILFNNFAFGQNHAYKSLTDKELAIISDLSSTFKDTTFVISPLIVSIIDSTTLDIPVIINKYAFSKGQFEDTIGDTILIKENKYFKIVCPDSLIKYENLKFNADYNIRNGIDMLQSPILNFIGKNYNKSGICYFNKPVFSKNMPYAIVKYWVNCGGLCGWGETVLMKKTKGKWIKIETLVFEES